MIIDNGTEFTSRDVVDRWAYEKAVQPYFIMPCRPIENGYTECFNVRDERLNQNWFLDLAEARHKIANWKSDYNHVRSRLALGHLTSIESAKSSATTGHGQDARWKGRKADHRV